MGARQQAASVGGHHQRCAQVLHQALQQRRGVQRAAAGQHQRTFGAGQQRRRGVQCRRFGTRWRGRVHRQCQRLGAGTQDVQWNFDVHRPGPRCREDRERLRQGRR